MPKLRMTPEGRPDKRVIYDWDRWFAKPSFRIMRGVHYWTTNTSMSQQVRNTAHTRGVRVTIKEHEDGDLGGLDVWQNGPVDEKSRKPKVRPPRKQRWRKKGAGK